MLFPRARIHCLFAALAFTVTPGLAQRSAQLPNYSSSLLAAAVPMPAAGAASRSAPEGKTAPPQAYTTPFSGLAIGVKVGTLGAGVIVATPLSRKFNLSGAANFFSYSDSFSSSGITYDANLRLRSAEASLDWFPWAKGFHISPGALLYDGNQVTGDAHVPGGDTLTLNGTTYVSSSADPVNGSGSLTFAKAAPKLTVGWGNMLPRSARRFSVPFEAGFAYIGNPKVQLNLAGTVCDSTGLNCRTIASDPTVQANITAQQQKIVNDVKPARFYPILSTGFSVSF